MKELQGNQVDGSLHVTMGTNHRSSTEINSKYLITSLASDRECQQHSQYLHCGNYNRSVEKRTKIFVDLEKTFDRMPWDLIWWYFRKKGVPEEIVQDMYRWSKMLVFTQKGETEYFYRGWITPMISPGSSLVHYNNGRSNGTHREGSILSDAVHGQPSDVCYDSWGSGWSLRNMESCGMGWRSAEQIQNTCRARQMIKKPQ